MDGMVFHGMGKAIISNLRHGKAICFVSDFNSVSKPSDFASFFFWSMIIRMKLGCKVVNVINKFDSASAEDLARIKSYFDGYEALAKDMENELGYEPFPLETAEMVSSIMREIKSAIVSATKREGFDELYELINEALA